MATPPAASLVLDASVVLAWALPQEARALMLRAAEAEGVAAA